MSFFKKIGQTATHNRTSYWEYQYSIGKYYLDQFITPCQKGKKVLDLGCGEGGVLAAFWDEGYVCAGWDNNLERINFARSHDSRGIKFFCRDIEHFESNERYDIVLLLDFIEHVADKEKVLRTIKNLLTEDGQALVTFPPYHSPFGGHQQMLRCFLKYVPYWHLLPRRLFVWVLKQFEKEYLEERIKIYDRRMTMKRFETLVTQSGLTIAQKVTYLIRPRQSLRFGLKVRINRIPILQEFLSTGVTYILTR